MCVGVQGWVQWGRASGCARLGNGGVWVCKAVQWKCGCAKLGEEKSRVGRQGWRRKKKVWVRKAGEWKCDASARMENEKGVWVCKAGEQKLVGNDGAMTASQDTGFLGGFAFQR